MTIDPEWIEKGKKDPLYAVAAHAGREKDGPNPWTPEEFLATGKVDLEHVLLSFAGHLPADVDRVFEIGCGSGRITHWLASQYPRVIAADISNDQIEMARTLTSEPANIEFVNVLDDTCDRFDGSIDLIYSSHVFQHFRSRKLLTQYLEMIARLLTPQGLALIHIPVSGNHGRDSWTWLYWKALRPARLLRFKLRQWLGRDRAWVEMYDCEDIFEKARRAGLSFQTLHVVPMQTCDGRSYKETFFGFRR